MLPKQNRITNKKDFEKVFKKGINYNGDFFILKVFKNNLGNSRIGIIVSQKVSKKATIRNKIKRRFNNIMGLEMPFIKKGFDMVLITKTGIEKEEFKRIKETMKKLLERAKLL